jgi:hypothetical protein
MIGHMKEWEDIYKMAKRKERKRRYIIKVKCVKDETGCLLTKGKKYQE